MFRNAPAVEITGTADDVAAADLVPLSHLALDLPQPPEGWADFLGRRAIRFLPDDLGRDCVRRQDARRLLDEHSEAELRKATLRQLAEQEADEADLSGVHGFGRVSPRTRSRWVRIPRP